MSALSVDVEQFKALFKLPLSSERATRIYCVILTLNLLAPTTVGARINP